MFLASDAGFGQACWSRWVGSRERTRVLLAARTVALCLHSSDGERK